MLKQRRAAAEKVAAELHIAEGALTAAIKHAASLVTTIQVAQVEANLSPVVVSDASLRVITCLKSLGDAHAELIAAHHELEEARVRIGLGAVAMGVGGGEKPASAEYNLRAIAA